MASLNMDQELTNLKKATLSGNMFPSLFYLRWIKNSNTLDKNNWINQHDSPQKRSWSGYAFEQICLEHMVEIKNEILYSSFYYNKRICRRAVGENSCLQ